MKRWICLILVLTLLFCVILCGCSAETAASEATPYVKLPQEAEPVETEPEFYETYEDMLRSLYVEQGYKLLMIKGHFDNVGTSTISDSAFLRKAVVNDGFEVEGFDVRINFIRDKYFEIDPYTDLDYVLYINIPEKLADIPRL